MKIIGNITLFCFSTVFLYLILIFSLSNINYKGRPLIYITNNYYVVKGGDTYFKFAEFDSQAEYDYIFLGTSRAYRGYDPRIFANHGYNTFNLGTGGQSIDNTYLIIKNLINGNNTECLIIDLYPNAFYARPAESSLDLIANVSSHELAMDILLNEKDPRHVNAFFSRLSILDQAPFYNDSDYVEKGFCTSNETLRPYWLEKLNSGELEDDTSTLSLEKLEILHEIIEYCDEQSIRLLFTIAPTSDFYPDKQHAYFLQQLKLIENRNTPLLDYSKKLKLSTHKMFYDGSHMNYSGVKLFNEKLIEDLKSGI